METKTAIIKGKRIVSRNPITPFTYGAGLWFYQYGCQEEVCEFILDNNDILEVTAEEYSRFVIGDSFTYEQDTDLNNILLITICAVLSAILAFAFFIITR